MKTLASHGSMPCLFCGRKIEMRKTGKGQQKQMHPECKTAKNMFDAYTRAMETIPPMTEEARRIHAGDLFASASPNQLAKSLELGHHKK